MKNGEKEYEREIVENYLENELSHLGFADETLIATAIAGNIEGMTMDKAYTIIEEPVRNGVLQEFTLSETDGAHTEAGYIDFEEYLEYETEDGEAPLMYRLQ